MRNNVPEKLQGLKTAVNTDRDTIIKWLKNNLEKLSQDDLLRGSVLGCPCGTCHRSQYKQFRSVFKQVGESEFTRILSEQLENYPQNVTLPETSYILLNWMKGQDVQIILTPFPEIQPVTGFNHLDSLSPSEREKMEKHYVYLKAVQQSKMIVEELARIGVPKKLLSYYLVHCHERWLSSYKAQMEAKKPRREDCFNGRFDAAIHGDVSQFIRFFHYHQDQELLSTRLLQQEHILRIPEIVKHIPASKVSWQRWGAKLLLRNARDPIGDSHDMA